MMTAERSTFPAPMVMRPFQSYRSPIDDRYIQDRKAREADLKEHNCVPYQDVKRKAPGEPESHG